MIKKTKTLRRPLTRKIQNRIIAVLVTSLATVILFAFLIPMIYGIVTSLKTEGQFAKVGAPWWPATEGKYEYQGETYDVYEVPINGEIKKMALVVKGREQSQLVDIDNPEAGIIVWDGQWRQLGHIWTFDAQWSNFSKAWNTINFPRLLGNTLMYASITTFGMVLSSSLVAYGFARFRIPKKSILFMLMIATVILPPAVTLIPSYFVFLKIGWVGTWLPLIVPAFFSWGTNVFLIRQFIMSIPRGVDEAAMMDGAGPFRIFFSVIIPQCIPALIAVALFHFFYAWNDFFNPLVYLSGNPEKFPITVGLTAFNRLYAQSFNLIQAAALITVVLPVIIFFFAQRFFMQGIVITGIEK
jgi:multiple sugar transport system permease protein